MAGGINQIYMDSKLSSKIIVLHAQVFEYVLTYARKPHLSNAGQSSDWDPSSETPSALSARYGLTDS